MEQIYLTDTARARLQILCPQTLKNLDADSPSLAEQIISQYNNQEEKSAEKFISIATTIVARFLLTDKAIDAELDALLAYLDSVFCDEPVNTVELLIAIFTYYLLEKPQFDAYRHLLSSYIFEDLDLGEVA